MLSVRNLVKSFSAAGSASVHAIKSVSFEVRQGDIFTLLGPSGCGKTTTLQCIAGLEIPSSGEIAMAGDVVYSGARQVVVPANKRRLGMVFQSYAIWPHMSVFDNVAFPLVHGARKFPAKDVRQRVIQSLELVKMAEYAERPAPHLSGGQQQRVALARALVHQPRLLLLDEPLSNLDAKLRDLMRVELRQLIKHLGITTIFVTHDQVEAMSMSDQIVLMRAGKIVQAGAPRDIYLRPESSFAADFMGRSNLIAGQVLSAVDGIFQTAFGPLHCFFPKTLPAAGRKSLVIRPQAIAVKPVTGPAHTGTPDNCYQGRVSKLNFLGDVVEAEVNLAGCKLRATLDPYLRVKVGDAVWLDFGRDRCVVVEAEPDAEPLPTHPPLAAPQPTPEKDPVP